MLLENKVAVIYGAGGPIGGAVARAFAHEGARVFLAGRTLASLDKIADPGQRCSVVLSNPPFGRKSSLTMVGADGRADAREESLPVE